MGRIIKLGFVFTLMLTVSAAFCQTSLEYSIIPLPAKMKPMTGYFKLSKQTVVSASKPLAQDAQIFVDLLNEVNGLKLNVYDEPTKVNFIRLKHNPKLKADAYTLAVTRSNVEITGGDNGVFYALQSLLQLVSSDSLGNLRIPCVQINDESRFQWRGMHLDASRHFFSKEFVKKYIDYLAIYKMNTFHWHLTDDQGWRIEIKKYPKLTQVGSIRKGTLISHASTEIAVMDTANYGGFYTQDDVREIVAYAKARHITVVPEIEMPGHAVAAISSYPFLSCSGKQIDVEQTWGVFDDVYCTKDSVFEFIEDVLLEVMDLFPSTYIHVGGDECPKTAWKGCPTCQARIKEMGLKNEEELQSYFIHRIEKFLNSHHRKLIGWDEILQGGLSPNSAVMSWQGIDGGIAAAKKGNFVVMTPDSHCYLNHYQGDPTNEPLANGGYTPLEKVYSYEPIPAELLPAQQKFILGAQGNMWSEYIRTDAFFEYMLFPRMCALAEVVWSPKASKNFVNFRIRLNNHFDMFDKRNINYSRAVCEIKKNIYSDLATSKLYIELKQEYSSGDIYYWFEDENGKATPTQKYETRVLVDKSCTFHAISRNKEGVVMNKVSQKFMHTKSTGAKIKLSFPPSSKYSYNSPHTLADGISGSIPWNGKEWLGFLENPMEAVIDLGEVTEVSQVLVHTLNSEASWIYLAKKATVEVSENGVDFVKFGALNQEEIAKIGRMILIKNNPVKARYVKVYVESMGMIGKGLPGADHNAWLFISEIGVE